MLFKWDQLTGAKFHCPPVKIIYTFDIENKTNFLARWPHMLDIQTGSLDENAQVGVIELKTCLQAILSARLDFLVL